MTSQDTFTGAHEWIGVAAFWAYVIAAFIFVRLMERRERAHAQTEHVPPDAPMRSCGHTHTLQHPCPHSACAFAGVRGELERAAIGPRREGPNPLDKASQADTIH